MTDKSFISILLPTFNCDAIIKTTLETIMWADEIIIIDSYSSDGTIEIAKTFGARVIQHEYINSVSRAKLNEILLNKAEEMGNVNINFELETEDQTLGYISDYETVTDTIPGTNFYGSRISFCTWPNLSLDGIDTVNINISAPQTDPLLTDHVEIYLVEDLPVNLLDLGLNSSVSI